MSDVEKRLTRWVNRWWSEAYFTPQPVDKGVVETHIRKVYALLGVPPPPIIWVASPAAPVMDINSGTALDRVRFERDFAQQAQAYHEKLAVVGGITKDEQERRPFGKQGWEVDSNASSFLDAFHTAVADTLLDARSNPIYIPLLHQDVVGTEWTRTLLNILSENATGDKPLFELQGAIEEIMKSTFFTIFSSSCVVCERPTISTRTDGSRIRLDNPSAPAIGFPDTFCKFYLQGLEFKSEVILNPEYINPQAILEENNQERRRILLERFGYESFIRDVKAELINSSEYGELYRVSFDRGDPLQMVKVINATPEPNGTNRRFFLRVPPTVRTAKEAVAWTFGMEEWEYEPARES